MPFMLDVKEAVVQTLQKVFKRSITGTECITRLQNGTMMLSISFWMTKMSR